MKVPGIDHTMRLGKRQLREEMHITTTVIYQDGSVIISAETMASISSKTIEGYPIRESKRGIRYPSHPIKCHPLLHIEVARTGPNTGGPNTGPNTVEMKNRGSVAQYQHINALRISCLHANTTSQHIIARTGGHVTTSRFEQKHRTHVQHPKAVRWVKRPILSHLAHR